jgi:hypothetical protein
MDADLQDSPEEIQAIHMITSKTLIWFPVGRKALRFSGCKNLPSKLFNWAARKNVWGRTQRFQLRIKAYKI